MLSLIKRLKNVVNGVLAHSPSEDAIFNRLKKSSLTSSCKNVIAVQCVEDVYYFGLFGVIASSLSLDNFYRVDGVVFHTIRLGESKSINKFFRSRLINFLLIKKWTNLYSSFCDGVGYKCAGFGTPIGDFVDIFRAINIFKKIKTKDELITLVIDGVPVGDLINDTFLRYKPAPTVDVEDVFLLIIIWQAHKDIRRAKGYFFRVRPKLYLTSYTTYIHHGIAARVALMAGVRVFSFGNYQEFCKKLSLEDWAHTKNPDSYAKDFKNLSFQMDRVALADKELSIRFAGGIDDATAYMKKSAYAQKNETVPNVQNSVVIFLHDFYDSPHCYLDMIFSDFWEWICFTVEALRSLNIRFFLKPHPNQINLSDGVLIDLNRRYSDLLLISSSISNKQLVEAGMSCAVTVYGTVAHEMAYLGVPSISCGHNPHISFEFCKAANDKYEYYDLLRGSVNMKIDKEVMRQQSLVFYYMHNLFLPPEMKILRDCMLVFKKNSEECNDLDLIKSLDKMLEQVGYDGVISRMMIN